MQKLLEHLWADDCDDDDDDEYDRWQQMLETHQLSAQKPNSSFFYNNDSTVIPCTVHLKYGKYLWWQLHDNYL